MQLSPTPPPHVLVPGKTQHFHNMGWRLYLPMLLALECSDLDRPVSALSYQNGFVYIVKFHFCPRNCSFV